MLKNPPQELIDLVNRYNISVSIKRSQVNQRLTFESNYGDISFVLRFNDIPYEAIISALKVVISTGEKTYEAWNDGE